jgi:hypothetical protein
MSFGEQGLANLGILENFAIECDPDPAIFVRDWLVTTREVDDREPAGSEGHSWLDVNAFIIWATVRDCAGHGQQSSCVKHSLSGQVERACNSTHRYVAHSG